MSAKSDLFSKAFFGKKAKMPRLDRFAEGGEAEASEPMESEPSGDVSSEEKLAAYDVLTAIGGEASPEKAERLAKSLKSFFLIVDAQPHPEGGESTASDEGSFAGI